MEAVDLVRTPAARRGGVVAIGGFDGVHPGHQALIGHAATLAAERGAALAILTFAPHPRLLFRPFDTFLVSAPDEQVEALARFGADVYPQAFSHELAAMAATEFVDRILVAGLGASHVVVGEDFCFGRGREGGIDMLIELGSARGFGVTAMPPFCDETGRPYSSTRVRNAIANGDMRLAADLLGRRWRVSGPVRDGRIALGNLMRPPAGRYAVEIDGRKGFATVERGEPGFDAVRIDFLCARNACIDFVQPAPPEA